MAAPVALILGAGPNIGKHAAAEFIQYGFRVASASRNRVDQLIDDYNLDIKFDASHPESIEPLFAHLIKTWGHPSVVIYNAAARTPGDANDPLTMSLKEVNHDVAVNVTSAHEAAKFAVQSFKALPASASGTFIYTGNRLNAMSYPAVLVCAMGKTAGAKMIWDASNAYKAHGFKFYYTDERRANGEAAKSDLDGEAAGKLFIELVKSPRQGPWHYTYVKDRGYVDFHALDYEKFGKPHS